MKVASSVSVAVSLAVPSLAPCLGAIGVDENVFDAWSWCASDVLEWRMPTHLDPAPARSLDKELAIDSQNPGDLVFVFRDGADSSFLPRELARFHAKGYGLEDQWALAPYAIDDATDLLYERRIRPGDVFWLAAPSLRALVWGLHDWVHFHNHGPFDEPALTELACDLVALEWLRLNREAVGAGDDDLGRVAAQLAALSRSRFEAEGKVSPVADLDALFAGPYPAGPR